MLSCLLLLQLTAPLPGCSTKTETQLFLLTQAPEGVVLPTSPALDVRNKSIFHQDVFMLSTLRTKGGVYELSDQRLKTQVGAQPCIFCTSLCSSACA